MHSEDPMILQQLTSERDIVRGGAQPFQAKRGNPAMEPPVRRSQDLYPPVVTKRFSPGIPEVPQPRLLRLNSNRLLKIERFWDGQKSSEVTGARMYTRTNIVGPVLFTGHEHINVRNPRFTDVQHPHSQRSSHPLVKIESGEVQPQVAN